MAVPSSGPLKLWDNIWNQEIGGTQGENSLHSASIYAGFSTPDAMSDFYGWSDVELPTVNTCNPSSVGTNSMQMNGCLTYDGNEASCVGWYFGTNANSYASNTRVGDGVVSSPNTFNQVRTGLGCNTTYYMWAFACNSVGTVIGSRVQAKTNIPAFSPSYKTFTLASYSAEGTGPNFGAQGYQGYLNPYTSGLVLFNGPCYSSPGSSACGVTNACTFFGVRHIGDCNGPCVAAGFPQTCYCSCQTIQNSTGNCFNTLGQYGATVFAQLINNNFTLGSRTCRGPYNARGGGYMGQLFQQCA